jgi:hypothetical protein
MEDSFFVLSTPETSKIYCSSCFNWYEHWKKKTGMTVDKCAVLHCEETHIIGLAVHLLDEIEFQKAAYVAPICKKCAEKSDNEVYELKGDTRLVAAVSCSSQNLEK